MEQAELKKIKKMYGENFMKLCRELFPTLLEQEGILFELLCSKFSNNAKTLYEDIVNEGLEGDFKNYIYSQIDVEKGSIIEEKTPKELLEEAGYDLIECTTEEEIQEFKKYYAKDEELCTFRGGRLNNCVVFFAVKKDVDDIKREDFKEPKREDEYGTSVMGIQFYKKGRCTVSIKNRYNHTVNNPDATYGNDLDRIIPGLTQSFAKLLQDRGLKLNSENIEELEIPGYVVAGDGKYYKYNYEIEGKYYCPGNIIIENGEVNKLENPEKQILIDYFIVDIETKTIELYDTRIEDSFIDAFVDIREEDKIEIRKNKEKGTREIRIQRRNQNEPIIIEIDKNNQIIGYKNNELKQVGNDFLFYNEDLTELEMPSLEQVENNFLNCNGGLTKLEMPSLEQVGDDFLCCNKDLTELEMPSLEQIGDNFLFYNKGLTELEMPELKQVGNSFLYVNKDLTKLEMPSLEQVGNEFLYCNKGLTELEMPELKQVGNSFLNYNKGLTKLEMPSLEQVGDYFLYCNEGLTKLEMPKLEQVEDYFLYYNKGLTKLEMPKLEQVEDYFLYYNEGLTELEMPSLEQVGDYFLYCNEGLTKLEMPNLEQVGNYFLNCNRGLTKLEMQKLEQAGSHFLNYNKDLTEIEVPSLEQVGNNFLYCNRGLTRLEMPSLEQVGNYFLNYNEDLTKLEMSELKEVGNNFLYYNKGLTELEMQSLEQVGDYFLCYNEGLTELEMPSLEQVGNYFLYYNKILLELGITYLEEIKEIFAQNRKQQTIDDSDIVRLDENNEMTTSEINTGRKIINEINRNIGKEER